MLFVYLCASPLCLVCKYLATVLFEHSDDERVGRLHRIRDKLTILSELEREGGDVVHHLHARLDVIVGDVGHHPVNVPLNSTFYR